MTPEQLGLQVLRVHLVPREYGQRDHHLWGLQQAVQVARDQLVFKENKAHRERWESWESPAMQDLPDRPDQPDHRGHRDPLEYRLRDLPFLSRVQPFAISYVLEFVLHRIVAKSHKSQPNKKSCR